VKCIKGNLTKLEAKGQKGELSYRITSSFAEPRKRDLTKPTTTSAPGGKVFSLPGNSPANKRLSQLSDTERPLHFELPVYPNGLFVYKSLS